MLNTAFLDELMADPYLAAALRENRLRQPGFNGQFDQEQIPSAPGPPAQDLPTGPDPYAEAPEREPGAASPIPNGGIVPVPPSATMAKGPGFMDRLKSAVPRMFTSVIAAGATPNIAGGAPVDIFRAMQAGQDSVRERDLLGYNMARQQAQDQLNREHVGAQIRQADAAARAHDAQAGYYGAQANAKVTPDPAHDAYNRWRVAAGDPSANPEVVKRLYEEYLQIAGHSPKGTGLTDIEGALLNEYANPATTPERRQQIKDALSLRHPAATPHNTTVSPGSTVLGPDNRPIYTAPPAAAPRPTIVPPGSTVLGADGKPVYTAPQREHQTPQATPAQFKTVEDTKNDRLLQAEQRAKKRLSDMEPEDQVYAELETEKQRIQQMYENEIAALGGTPTHFQYPPLPKDNPPALPPEAASRLKEGVVTTFQNGQKWTLKNGKPTPVN